jgi:signal peptidase I
MWDVQDYILIDFIEAGDVIKINNDIVFVREIEYTPHGVIVRGLDDTWNENGEWTVDPDAIVPVLIEQ